MWEITQGEKLHLTWHESLEKNPREQKWLLWAQSWPREEINMLTFLYLVDSYTLWQPQDPWIGAWLHVYESTAKQSEVFTEPFSQAVGRPVKVPWAICARGACFPRCFQGQSWLLSQHRLLLFNQLNTSEFTVLVWEGMWVGRFFFILWNVNHHCAKVY